MSTLAKNQARSAHSSARATRRGFAWVGWGCGGVGVVVWWWVGGWWMGDRWVGWWVVGGWSLGGWVGGGWDEHWPKEELAKRGIGQKRPLPLKQTEDFWSGRRLRSRFSLFPSWHSWVVLLEDNRTASRPRQKTSRQ